MRARGARGAGRRQQSDADDPYVDRHPPDGDAGADALTEPIADEDSEAHHYGDGDAGHNGDDYALADDVPQQVGELLSGRRDTPRACLRPSEPTQLGDLIVEA